jgi:hypothetical protein
LGHKYESVVTPPTATEQGYTTHTCTVCGDSYVDSYTDPVATPDVAIKFASINLTLDADLTVTYWVTPEVMAQYENVRVEFTMDDKNIVVSEYKINTSNNRAGFDFPGVAPYQIKRNIVATIYGTYQGVEYYATLEVYSAYKYLTGSAVWKSNDAELMTLAVDLMNYGTFHQLYTNNYTDELINAGLTADQKAYATAEDPEMVSVTNGKYVVLEGATAKFSGVTLDLENAVIVRMTTQLSDLTGISVRFVVDGVTYIVDASEFALKEGTTDTYYVYFRNLKAIQFSSNIEITLCKDGTPISNTLLYSVESYAYSKRNDTSYAYLADLVKAMMKYGNAAYAYSF